MQHEINPEQFFVSYSEQLDGFHVMHHESGIRFCIRHTGGAWRKLRSIKVEGKCVPKVVVGKQSWLTRVEAIEELLRKGGLRVGRVVEDGAHWLILPRNANGSSESSIEAVIPDSDGIDIREDTESASFSTLVDDVVGTPLDDSDVLSSLPTLRKLKKPKKLKKVKKVVLR